jgi:hypothetical protein
MKALECGRVHIAKLESGQVAVKIVNNGNQVVRWSVGDTLQESLIGLVKDTTKEN